MPDKPKVPRHKLLQIAGAVPADPATVQKVLDGRRVRGSIGDRIRDELARRSINVPESEEDED